MNDWIIWTLMCLGVSEIIFILFRINKVEILGGNWIMDKIVSILSGIMLGVFHLFWLVEAPAGVISEAIFHWDRLIYELFIIMGLVIFFICNYFISKLIDKFHKKESNEVDKK